MKKFYVIDEETLLRAGIDITQEDRIFQWYGIQEAIGDIQSGYVKLEGKTEDELIDMIEGGVSVMDTSGQSWDHLSIDMQHELDKIVEKEGV